MSNGQETRSLKKVGLPGKHSNSACIRAIPSFPGLPDSLSADELSGERERTDSSGERYNEEGKGLVSYCWRTKIGENIGGP